jgi:ATP synthase protein I
MTPQRDQVGTELAHSNRLAEAARRDRGRRNLGRAHQGRSFARNLMQIGALGWLIVTPLLAGVFVGRALDRWSDGGIFWTGALIALGLALGCWLAWKRMMEEQ